MKSYYIYIYIYIVHSFSLICANFLTVSKSSVIYLKSGTSFCIFLRDFLLPNCGERVWFWHDVLECKATHLNVTYGQNVLGLTKVIYLEQIYWHENEDKKRIKASFIVNQPENWFFVDRRNNIFSWMIICFRRSASAINF